VDLCSSRPRLFVIAFCLQVYGRLVTGTDVRGLKLLMCQLHHINRAVMAQLARMWRD